MKRLVWANILWNCLFVAMGVSEMTGITEIHPSLPPSFKWIWLCALAGGNLVIHLLQLRTLSSNAAAARPAP